MPTTANHTEEPISRCTGYWLVFKDRTPILAHRMVCPIHKDTQR